MRTNDYACIKIGILFYESLGDGEGLVVFVCDGENDLKVGVFLAKGGFEIFEQVCVESFEWA